MGISQSKIPTPKKSSALSLAVGGGSGSGLIVFLDSINLEPSKKLLLQAAVPWVASFIGLATLVINNMLNAQFKYWGVQFFLWRAKRHAANLPDGDDHADLRKTAQDNIKELEKILIELNAQGAKRVVEITSH